MMDVFAAESNSGGRRLSGNSLWFKPCAKQRWRILAKAIQLQKQPQPRNPPDEEDSTLSSQSATPPSRRPFIDVLQICEDSSVMESSVRRFGGFGLIKCNSNQSEPFEQLQQRLCGQARNWYTYQVPLQNEEYSLQVHHLLEMVSVYELMGFNNTGNICLWPSEEALTAYVLENKNLFTDKSVLELGGGMTCLAGLFIAKYCRPFLVHLTDGNAKSVENVQTIVRMNELESMCFLKVSLLKWETLPPATTKVRTYDFILCADCLFFDETRPNLIATIDALLNGAGQALVMAPRRGNTFQQFIDGCLRRGFNCRVVYRYSHEVWQRLLKLKATNGREYNEDIHYPILIVLTRKVAEHDGGDDNVYGEGVKSEEIV